MAMLERLIDLTLDQLGAQVQSFGSLDAKAGTVLGADAVFAGLIFRRAAPHGGLWLPITLAAIGASLVAGVAAMWTGRPLLGPLASVFYRQHGDRDAARSQRQLLADLADAVETNQRQLALKAMWWVVSATSLMLSVALALLAQV